MDFPAFALRLFHILPAVLLAGGILFMWSSLLPGLSGMDEATRKSVMDAVRGKWAKIVMGCSALLLATGLINAINNIKTYDAANYHVYVLLKLVLALAVMFITARLSGRSASAEKFREKISFWMSVNTALVLALILIATTMRVTEKTPKVKTDDGDVSVQLEVEQE